MKVVLDTNIWVSGLLLPGSSAGKILLDWRAEKFSVVTSQPILDELHRVLSYPKIQRRIQWDPSKIDQYILLVQFLTDFISIDDEKVKVIVERDLDDTAILKTLVISHSDYLITGDKDLLALKKQYPIVTLSEFEALFF